MSKIDEYRESKKAYPSVMESIDKAKKLKCAYSTMIKRNGGPVLISLEIAQSGFNLIDDKLVKYLGESIAVCMPHLLEKAREIAQRELDGQRIAALAEAKDIQNEIEMKD